MTSLPKIVFSSSEDDETDCESETQSLVNMSKVGDVKDDDQNEAVRRVLDCTQRVMKASPLNDSFSMSSQSQSILTPATAWKSQTPEASTNKRLNSIRVEQQSIVKRLKSERMNNISFQAIRKSFKDVQLALSNVNETLSKEKRSVKEERDSQIESNSQIPGGTQRAVKKAKRILCQQKVLVKLLKIHKEIGNKMKVLEGRLLSSTQKQKVYKHEVNILKNEAKHFESNAIMAKTFSNDKSKTLSNLMPGKGNEIASSVNGASHKLAVAKTSLTAVEGGNKQSSLSSVMSRQMGNGFVANPLNNLTPYHTKFNIPVLHQLSTTSVNTVRVKDPLNSESVAKQRLYIVASNVNKDVQSTQSLISNIVNIQSSNNQKKMKSFSIKPSVCSTSRQTFENSKNNIEGSHINGQNFPRHGFPQLSKTVCDDVSGRKKVIASSDIKDDVEVDPKFVITYAGDEFFTSNKFLTEKLWGDEFSNIDEHFLRNSGYFDDLAF